MRLISTAVMGVIIMGMTGNASAGAASFTLVDGSQTAVIAIPPDASPAEVLAAREIFKYIKQMSGKSLKIKRTSNPAAGSVVISRSGKSTSDIGGEGYSISIKEKRLYLTGAHDRSVLYTAYDLLERLGCRWLSPEYSHYNGKAEYIPQKAKLTVNLDQPVIEKPVLKYRKLYVEEGLSHTQENLLQMVEWMSKSRFNTLVVPIDYQGSGRVKWDNWRKALIPELRRRDILIEVGGHGYQNFLNAEMESGKLYELHPEWFGMDDQGKRRPDPKYVFCSSNTAAVEHLTASVVKYLKEHSEIDIFDFWPPDGGVWCACENCKKLGPPEDRQSKLLAQVLDSVHKQGINTRFECIAYSTYKTPPTNPVMDPSVLVDFCPISQSFEKQIHDASSRQNTTYIECFNAWQKQFKGDFSVYSYYRKYAWRSLPVIIPHYMQEDLRWYVKSGADGISTYSEPGDWQTYQLNHYTLARLAWNPEVNVDSIISDFCVSLYGKAAEAAKSAYQALEDVVRVGCSIPGTSMKEPGELQKYIERLQTAKASLVKVTEPGSPAESLLLSIDYALCDLTLQKHIAEKGSPADRIRMVDELIEFQEKHKDQGVFVLHGRSRGERLMKQYQALESAP